MKRLRTLLCAGIIAAGVSGCAGPFKSTASLVSHDTTGGTVRIMSDAYPPDADVQQKASELMSQACNGGPWKVVDIFITEAKVRQSDSGRDNSNWAWVAGYGIPPERIPNKTPGQNVDLLFACSRNAGAPSP